MHLNTRTHTHTQRQTHLRTNAWMGWWDLRQSASEYCSPKMVAIRACWSLFWPLWRRKLCTNAYREGHPWSNGGDGCCCCCRCFPATILLVFFTTVVGHHLRFCHKKTSLCFLHELTSLTCTPAWLFRFTSVLKNEYNYRWAKSRFAYRQPELYFF